LKKIYISFLFLCLVSPAGSSEKKWEVYFTNPSGIKKTGTVNPRDGLISAVKKFYKKFLRGILRHIINENRR
jgi:hypothetical protein